CGFRFRASAYILFWDRRLACRPTGRNTVGLALWANDSRDGSPHPESRAVTLGDSAPARLVWLPFRHGGSIIPPRGPRFSAWVTLQDVAAHSAPLLRTGHWRSWLARFLDMEEVTGSSPVWPIFHFWQVARRCTTT